MSSDQFSEKVVIAVAVSTAVGILLLNGSNRERLQKWDPERFEEAETSGLFTLGEDIGRCKPLMQGVKADYDSAYLISALEYLLPVRSEDAGVCVCGVGGEAASIWKSNKVL